MIKIAAIKILIAISFLTISSTIAHAQELEYDIRGVVDPLLTNVRGHVESFRLTGNVTPGSARFERVIADAEVRAKEALKPFGYYIPTIESAARADGTIVMQIEAGRPITVTNVNLQVVGGGAEYSLLTEWRAAWPLHVGAILDQTRWEAAKLEAVEIARARGFLQAGFSEQSIEIDLDNFAANLTLVFDTGSRSVMGKITYQQEVLRPSVLESIPRFDEGDSYTAFLMEKFRTDLWKTGYFTDVEVLERERTDINPPVVDLQVNLRTDTRNSYQGSIGVGSDTGMRVQAKWSRHPVSSLGDRLDTAIGWLQRDEEILLRTTYRIPRRSVSRQFWVGEAAIKTEQQDFQFRENPEDEDSIELAAGRINDYLIKGGRLKVRNLHASGHQAFETIFAQYLHETKDFDLLSNIPPVLAALAGEPDFDSRLKSTTRTLAIGIDWDRPAVRGKGFQTVGRRDRAWAMWSDNAWGSDIDFAQIYLSTIRQYIAADRWKFLLRAEAGYTEAKVDEYTVTIGDRDISLGITRLPDLYRFKAGGAQSVRGYGFEDLSDNDLGSNNLFTASAELEMRFLENWSAAAFLDIGNAFNDWSDPDLKRGAGIGIRWYSIAGAIRVDYARALDFEGKPWQWHFSIGTPLL